MSELAKGREGTAFLEERSNIRIGQKTFLDQMCSIEHRQLSSRSQALLCFFASSFVLHICVGN
jgi:hypothetical protein